MEKSIDTKEYLNTLRALATVAVILIHVSSPLVNMTWMRNMPYWWVGNVADSAVRFGVPIFLMISGATMLGRSYKITDFYKRRLSRVFIPFIFWLAFYVGYRWLMLSPTQQNNETGFTQWAWDLFLHEGVSKHFWYVYMILFIYAALPLLSAFVRKLNVSQLTIGTLVWVFVAIAGSSMPFNAYNWETDYITKFSGYFLHTAYVLLGYLLSQLPVWNKKYLAIGIFILTIVISAVYTFWLSNESNKLNLTIYSYLSFNTFAQSAAVFMIFSGLKVKQNFLSRIISTISNYSYGIYLVHIMVIGILFRNGIYWKITHPVFSLIILTLSVLFLSWATIFIIRKIPGGKHISG